MGKAGRAACIFTPMALTIASLVCIILINLGGYTKRSDTLNDLSFFEVDFSNFSSSSSSSELPTILETARESGAVADFYQVHLWNYCTGNETDSTSSSNSTKKVSWCSSRKMNFWFDPLNVFNIESVINSTTASVTGTDESASSLIQTLTGKNVTALEDEFLDDSARKALKTYKKVSSWMFAAYFASLWLLLATVVFGVLAVFSRWFAFITWIISIVSTVLVFAASLTATIMFPILVKALKETLGDYNISFKTTKHTLSVTWLATAFTLLATLFWLFSTCCCSGSSNPHHRSNKEAPAKELGLTGNNSSPAMSGGLLGRGRTGTKVEKTGGYERVGSPYHGRHESDNVPLTHVAAPPGYGHGEAGSYYQNQQSSPYEPYRHN